MNPSPPNAKYACSLVASFEAMREHQPHLIPVMRTIYGTPAPIWLERSSGPLRAASVTVPDDGPEAPGLAGMATGYCHGPDPTDAATFVRACKGGHQGCPLATNACILACARFLSLGEGVNSV